MNHPHETPTTARVRLPRLALVLAGGLFVGVVAGPAAAQEAGPAPGENEMREKVVEIERLMKRAEALLARSLDRRRARDRAQASGDEIEKLLDEKAQEESGQSAEELRKLAEEGSSEAAETLRRLTEEATREATDAARERIEELMEGGGEGSGGAATGIREILEESQAEGRRSKELLEWILEQARKQEQNRKQGGSGGGEQKPKDDGEKPEDKKEQPSGEQKPESPRDKADEPPMEAWLAQLPDQVRKAYEAQDWDSIPPRWRALLRAWTRKMAEELEQEE